MDTSKFTESKTGDLVPIVTPKGPDHAFLPYNLPPGWRIPGHLWPKVAEARAAVAKLDGIGATLPDQELLLSPLKTREAITSSRIEGTYATVQELMLFELDPQEPKSSHDQINSRREVSNYAKALTAGIGQLEKLPFCGMVIRDLHSILMDGVRGQHSIPGTWRNVQIAIGSNWRFVPPPPTELQNCIDAFESYVKEDASNDYDPLVRAYLAHYQFEAIHPFVDGNGRIGRVILSLMIAKWCKLSQPWLYMSSFFEKYKEEYVTNMFKVSAEGAWETWVDFCLTGTIHQANDAIQRCAKLIKLKAEMLARGHSGSIRAERIINGLFSSPFVRVSNLHKKLGVSYPTAQSDIDRLEKLNILKPLPNLRPKCYYSPEIYEIAFAEQNA
ncbi:MAG: filamentation induced by cAMP protein fic [Pedosphaera sp.]|nr:filamentation induced by cAMP protein fic [Pedosphaera sp.]